MAALEGVELVSPGRNIQLTPYGTFAREQLFTSGVPPAMSDVTRGGLDAMRHLVDVRQRGGPFTDLFDFVERIDPRQVNKRAIENLARDRKE